jgi:hypothetical protein
MQLPSVSDNDTDEGCPQLQKLRAVSVVSLRKNSNKKLASNKKTNNCDRKSAKQHAPPVHSRRIKKPADMNQDLVM